MVQLDHSLRNCSRGALVRKHEIVQGCGKQIAVVTHEGTVIELAHSEVLCLGFRSALTDNLAKVSYSDAPI